MRAIHVSVRVAPVRGRFLAMVTMGTAPITVLHYYYFYYYYYISIIIIIISIIIIIINSVKIQYSTVQRGAVQHKAIQCKVTI